MIDYKDFTIMTFKFKSKFADLKNFQNRMKKIQIDSNKRVDFDNFMEALDIIDAEILNKLNYFVK